MKILALITARGGSKRLPRKNIRLLGGKPLISWSIDVAKNIPEICDILVSTDDIAIADIAKKEGAYVPWLRPNDLANDNSSSVDVALHALDWYEAKKEIIDGLLLLQPTSPFRSKETIQRGIELFTKHNCQTVIGVSLAQTHPMWTFKIENNYLLPFIHDHGLEMRSQDLPKVYAVNGSFYLISPKELRQQHSFMKSKAIPLIVEPVKEALDIDTDLDFKMAESILASHYEN